MRPDAVTLRAQTDEDFDTLYAIAADLDSWEERGPAAPAPLTREAYRHRLDSTESAGIRFMICVDYRAIGRIDLFDEDPLARTAEVGMALEPDARGKGYGTAALRQVVQFGFERRNLRRLHLVAIASNAAAIGCYRNVGFVEEGRRREHCWVRGRYEDEVLMGLLRDDWARTR
ncbi:MAG TPA: GNAT family protein [Jatrophihabitantaceae bacterium]|nr:GNAT family protein [Jatrophihabitantaceae bacterium]